MKIELRIIFWTNRGSSLVMMALCVIGRYKFQNSDKRKGIVGFPMCDVPPLRVRIILKSKDHIQLNTPLIITLPFEYQ